MVRGDVGRPIIFRTVDQSGGKPGRYLPVRKLDRFGAERLDHLDHQLRLLHPNSQALHVRQGADRPHAIINRPRAGIVERQADKTMALRARQDLVADRVIEHLVQMIERAEQERQREHVRRRNQRSDRRDIGAIEIDGADPRLFDGVFLFPELARMEHANAVATRGALLDQAGPEHERLHGRIIFRLGIGDAEFAPGCERRCRQDGEAHRRRPA